MTDGSMPADAAGRGADVAWAGRLHVLALDGGGAKALFTAHVLAQLEEDLGVVIADSFDLIAGTSAGGIIALALGAGLRPAEIVEHYEVLIEQVFPHSRRSVWRRPRQLFRPVYDADALRTALAGVFGDLRVGDSGKRLVVPSWDVQRGGVHVFKTPHHDRLRRDWRTSMVDAANATAAAPLYFPAARVGGLRLIDGGVWANNPSVVAIAEATSMLGASIGNVRVLNIGTMEPDTSHGKHLDDAGLLGWAKPAASMILNASSRGGQGIAEHLVGKQNYVRFDAPTPRGAFALDAVDREDVVGLAASASRILSPTYQAQFAAHRAAAYTPAFSIPTRTGSTSENRPEAH
ncbi:CBASS cGAMP-activated phospholipase [Microbacterium sp. CJ88]|uniref:CBASS cGAMP-activated phospholipase n=1 Tax=Microbacterium sp. CJ88 TaxID=3445672 RepID=UPI003F655256